MSLDLLRDACDRNKVLKVAFVDDIFDVPAVSALERGRYRKFKATMADDKVRNALLGTPAGEVTDPLPAFEDLVEDDLEPYWRLLVSHEVKGEATVPDGLEAVRSLFEQHGEAPLGMLAMVGAICRLFAGDLGRELETFGRRPDVAKVAQHDLVLVDFFLEQRISVEKALAMTVDLVKKIKGVRANGGRSPSFVLVSSRPDEIDAEAFRRRASLLRSRFRFVPKVDLGKSTGSHLVDIHDVLEATEQATEIEALVDDWRRAALRSVEAVHDKMLEFDVSDFVYLDCFRLYREGTSLGSYLRWMMTAYLQSKVPESLDRDTWAKAEALRLFDPDEYPTGNPDQDRLVKSFEGPGQAVGRAYGSILVDSSRGSETPFPVAPSSADLLEGDMFVRRRAQDADHEGAGVLMVMTPSCDLIVRGGEEAPSAATVLLLPGTLRRVDGETQPREIGDVEFVHVVEKGPEGEKVVRIYTIEWRLKEVTSLRWADIASGATLADHGRLGRLREPYFNHVRERFVAGVTRIGREVPPLFPVARAGEVAVRVARGSKVTHHAIMSFGTEEALVWSFPASVRKPPRKTRETPEELRVEGAETVGPSVPAPSEPVAQEPVEGAVTSEVEATGVAAAKEEPVATDLFHVSRKFLKRLVAAVEVSTLLEAEAKSKLGGVCASFELALSLLQPGRSGTRKVAGQNKVIELKVGDPDVAGVRKSQSMLLLVLRP